MPVADVNLSFTALDVLALLREVDELWDPETTLMTHNERVLIDFCRRLAQPLRALVSPRAQVFVVPGCIHCADEDDAWTLSTDPGAPGWDTEDGLPGYGLTRAVAEAYAAAINAGTAPASLQDLVGAQMQRICKDDPTDVAERRDRHAEEDAELLQALGMTREAHHRVVDYVHDRPVGEPAQEMGGTMHTLAALAVYAGLDMMACGHAEFDRVARPDITAKIRRKRANRHGRGPLPGDDADLVTTPAA